jgi:hypothetical protein
MSGWELHIQALETVARNQFGKWLRLSQVYILLVMVGGSIEDERLFSQMNDVKNRLRSNLLLCLPHCLRLRAQKMYTTFTFPFERALAHFLKSDRRQRLARKASQECM